MNDSSLIRPAPSPEQEAAPAAAAPAAAASAPPPQPPLTPEHRALWQRSGLILGVTALALFGLFLPTFQSLTNTWNGSATYNHCWLILPIVGWLVWQRKDEVAQLTPRPFLPGLLVMAAAAALWLLGDAADINIFRQAGLVGMLQAAVLTVLGLQVTRGLLFPLFYMVFLLPAGDELVPTLQNITADFSVWMLKLLDIPTFRDGIFISIPTGDFEVAEACSGVRFLIATIALGVLYAHIGFRTWPRRVLVMALFMSVPILANAIRAFGIIMIAHLSNMEHAVGVDHLVYGWGFFAVVTVVLLLICRPFSDRTVDDPTFDVAALKAWPSPAAAALPAPGRPLWLGAAVCVALAAGVMAYGRYIDARPADVDLMALKAPQVPGWTPRGPDGDSWKPVFVGADSVLWQTYARADGRTAVLHVAVYERQREGGEMIAFGNGPTPPDLDWVWSANLRRPSAAEGGAVPPRAFQAQGHGEIREFWQWYYVNGVLTPSATTAKIEQIKAKLFGGSTVAASVILTALRRDPSVSSEPVLADFRQDLGEIQPRLEAMLASAQAPAGKAR